MEVNEIVALITNQGFSIAITIYLLYLQGSVMKEVSTALHELKESNTLLIEYIKGREN